MLLDCELLPWSAKAGGLIREQYASVGAAANTALPAVATMLATAAGRGLDVTALRERMARRGSDVARYRDAYRRYVRPTDGLTGITLAPFAVLAAEAMSERM